MQKRDIPTLVALLLAAGIGVLASRGYEPIARNPVTQVAAASKAQVSGQRITLSPQKSTAFAAYAAAELKTTTETTLSGRIEAYYSESKAKFQGSDMPLKFALLVGRERYELKNLGGELPPRIDGAQVTLTGFVSGKAGKKELLVNLTPAETRTIRGATPVATGARSQSLDCVDAFCALVIPVDMTGQTSGLPLPADIEAHIFNGAIKDALAEESYGAVEYNGDVTDWISVPSQTLNVFSFPSEVEQYLLANNLDPAGYDQVVMLINGGSQSNGGEASIGATYVSWNGGYVVVPVALVGFASYQNNANLTASNGNLSYFDYLYTHETGHSMNALHDNMYSCKSGPMSIPSECMNIEYGNKYSIMGDGSYGGHFSFWQKIRAGWMSMPALSATGTYSLSPIESSGVTALGVDGDTDYVSEYIMERRTSTGLDSLNLFTTLNLNGVFLYRMKNWSDPGTTSDPLSWDVGLVDTTPHLQSSRWFESMNDVVFKQPQRFVDRQNLVQFAQSLGGDNNTVIVSPGYPVANPCTMSPVRVFEPYINAGDRFTGQIPIQKWPVRTGMPSVPAELVQNVQADVTDPSAQVFLYKNIMMFNDDFVACGAGQYNIEFFYNGQSVPLITESSVTYQPWSGPFYNQVMGFLPVYGETYGNKTVTLKITKLNDGSIFSQNLVFNLVP